MWEIVFEVICKLTRRVTIEIPWTKIDKKQKRLQGYKGNVTKNCFENTFLFIENKDRGFDLKSQHTAAEKGFVAHSKHFTHNVNLARSPSLELLTSP